MSVGLPYARAGVDAEGYFVTCPVCGHVCRGRGSKAANRVYAQHYAAEHEEEGQG